MQMANEIPLAVGRLVYLGRQMVARSGQAEATQPPASPG
jgi:hypothetical protein